MAILIKDSMKMNVVFPVCVVLRNTNRPSPDGFSLSLAKPEPIAAFVNSDPSIPGAPGRGLNGALRTQAKTDAQPLAKISS